ncbi:MAG: hypothetical protein CL955_06540 [Erythrobacteraceae bacterium]|nr:hypothetical protein [Erythrobacteraceae bacterium]
MGNADVVATDFEPCIGALAQPIIERIIKRIIDAVDLRLPEPATDQAADGIEDRLAVGTGRIRGGV